MKTEIINYKGRTLKVIEVLENIKSSDELFFEKWSEFKHCLKAIKQNGYSLRYVKEQTETLCLEAVKQNGYSLQYVKDKKILLK